MIIYLEDKEREKKKNVRILFISKIVGVHRSRYRVTAGEFVRVRVRLGFRFPSGRSGVSQHINSDYT